MTRRRGPPPDAVVVAAIEKAGESSARIQRSLDAVLDHNDRLMSENQPIPLSWLSREKNLLAHMRSAQIWNEADGGEDEEAPR